ncbi:hypothetical protein ACIBCT_40025 [Streptosporangium sp. NPDC050855]|uniref:hypothetical protein n=1 Tax=Streptosporangium sp. NPDC050855 TaxID=3366194 RepID=UPI00379C4AE2
MVEQHRGAALRAFVDQLNELHERAGSPALAHLDAISKRICEDDQDRTLPTSTTHDILRGKRKRAPSWAWVSCFVAACTIAADRTGLDVRGMGDMDAWAQRWRTARGTREARPASPATPPRPITTQAASPAPVPHLAQQPALAPLTPTPAPLTPAPVMPSPALSVREGAPRRPATPVVFAPLPEDRQRLLEIYGRTGTRLLEHSQEDNGEDCMRLAVIALLRGWPPEALHWLRRASDAGQSDAAGLFNDPHRLQVAAELACRYGRHYQCFPTKLSLAMFFYRLAADHGHAEAAYRLAGIHRAKEEGKVDSLLDSSAAGAPVPVAAELLTDTPSAEFSEDLDAVLRRCLIDEGDGVAAQPTLPAGESPPEFA